MSTEKLINQRILLRRRMLDKLREATAPAPVVDGEAPVPLAPPVVRRRKTSRNPGLYVAPEVHGGLRTVFRKKKKQDGSLAGGEDDKGAKSERGFTTFNGHEVQHESFQEHKVSCYFQADRETADIFSQQPRVDYVDAEDQDRYTIFDYLVIKKSGKRVGVAVKDESEREEVEAMFDMIAATSNQDVIDEAIMVSGQQVTLQKYNNALDVLWARDFAQHPEVEIVVALLAGRTEIQFWELYDRAFMGSWKRKAAIWDLIDRGVLEPVNEDERITDLSRLAIRR